MLPGLQSKQHSKLILTGELNLAQSKQDRFLILAGSLMLLFAFLPMINYPPPFWIEQNVKSNARDIVSKAFGNEATTSELESKYNTSTSFGGLRHYDYSLLINSYYSPNLEAAGLSPPPPVSGNSTSGIPSDVYRGGTEYPGCSIGPYHGDNLPAGWNSAYTWELSCYKEYGLRIFIWVF